MALGDPRASRVPAAGADADFRRPLDGLLPSAGWAVSLGLLCRAERQDPATHLRGMIRWATLASVGVAATAMAYRGVWPTRIETFVLAASTVSILGALHLCSPRSRAACAAVWVVLLIWLGVPTPPRSFGWDFRTFYDGARILFDRRQSPYAAQGATAFPFPTFHLVHALSLGGWTSPERTFLSFLMLQFALLALGLVLMGRVVRTEISGGRIDLARWLLLVGLLLHPAVLAAMALGNSGAIAGSLLMCAVWLWRCGTGGWSRHASAIFLNLAWMVKPQLLMAMGFFLLCWWLERPARQPTPTRSAAIGGLVLPWAAGLVAITLPIAFPGSLQAYRDFPGVAIAWHRGIAEAYPNNYALSAILAKAILRMWAVPVSQILPLLTGGIAVLLVLWNALSLAAGRLDSLRAFLPWLLASLLWTSLVWEWYLSLVLAGLLLMVGISGRPPVTRVESGSLRLCAGIGFSLVLSSFAFILGILLLYFHSHDMRVQEVVDSRGAAGE